MLRGSTGSFVPTKASICSILNFIGRGKYSTPTVNKDSVCCTKASMETGARPFTTSFIWMSSCWMSRTAAPKIVPHFPANKGLAHHLHRSYQASPHCDHLRGVCRDHAQFGYFLLLHQRLGGRRGVVVPPMEWYCGLQRPVVRPMCVASIW